MERLQHIPERDEIPHRVLVLLCEMAAGDAFDRHVHVPDQLSWVSTGTLSAEVGSVRHSLPSTLAIWIPGGVEHRLSTPRATRFTSLYFAPGHRPDLPDHPVAVRATPVFSAVITHLADPTLEPAARAVAERMLATLLVPVDLLDRPLPMPDDPRARELAEVLLSHPGDRRSLDDLARTVAASPRNLRRIFLEQTGLTVSDWRTRARLQEAVAQLTDRVAVTEVAYAVGYSRPSAFIHAFQRHFGQSPARFVAAAVPVTSPGRRERR